VKKIAILGHQEFTAIVLEHLLDLNIGIFALIGLCQEKSLKISEYVDLEKLASDNNIKHYYVDDYSLKSEESNHLFRKESFDIVLVAGWSRLIPASLLSSIDTQFIGWHGGPFLPPRCRGRAVVNWAIINNESDFFVYSMLIDQGVDSGHIIETGCVSIQTEETAQSLYIKCAFAVTQLFTNFILRDDKISLTVQPSEGATYLPKRSPEDGEIDWRLPANVITRLVRALSKPFPHAWSKIHGEKLYLKRARVIDMVIGHSYKHGQIINILHGNELIIQTSKGLLLIEEYEYNDFTALKRLDSFNESQLLRNITKIY
jgi:methionyl-tRNA formyltransferase